MVKKPENESIEDDIDEAWANSVKKVIILADVLNVPENYNNIMILWNQIGLNNLKLVCACDHKMSNIICGIQSASASHPCHICDATNPRGSHDWAEGQLRTLGSNRHNYEAWLANGSKLSDAKVRVTLFLSLAS